MHRLSRSYVQAKLTHHKPLRTRAFGNAGWFMDTNSNSWNGDAWAQVPGTPGVGQPPARSHRPKMHEHSAVMRLILYQNGFFCRTKAITLLLPRAARHPASRRQSVVPVRGTVGVLES